MKKPAVQPNYTALVRAIRLELGAGEARVADLVRHEVLRSVWNVGRAMLASGLFTPRPSPANGQAIRRLRGIDTPELSTPAGLKARLFVRERLENKAVVVMKTYKDDKYGRMLADVFYAPADTGLDQAAAEGIFLNQELLDAGLAVLSKS